MVPTAVGELAKRLDIMIYRIMEAVRIGITIRRTHSSKDNKKMTFVKSPAMATIRNEWESRKASYESELRQFSVFSFSGSRTFFVIYKNCIKFPNIEPAIPYLINETPKMFLVINLNYTFIHALKSGIEPLSFISQTLLL